MMTPSSQTAPVERLVYTAKTHTSGGREKGISRSSDGRLDIKLSVPGAPGVGANPEQLLAAGWSACFESSIAIAARRRRIVLPADVAIDAEIDLNSGHDGYFLRARLKVAIPGIDRAVGEELIRDAETICPYSKATRGNIDVAVNLA
jgi:Ohr subfamily peroxiredoxin